MEGANALLGVGKHISAAVFLLYDYVDACAHF